LQYGVFVPPKEKNVKKTEAESVTKISLFDDQREEFGNSGMIVQKRVHR